MSLARRVKIFLVTVLVLSVFFSAIINFSLIWYILAILSLVLFVYGVVISRAGSKGSHVRFPIASCAVLIISALFIFAGPRIGDFLATKLGVAQVEVRPTWAVTMDIAHHVIFQKSVQPLFGVGPNRFQDAWALYKPAAINTTAFWSSDFNYGVGIIPSALVTTGLIGFLSWIVFLALLVYIGFRSILSKFTDPVAQFLVISSFMSAVYLWLFTLIYIPSLTLIVFAFFFTGLFIASLTLADILHPMKIEYFKNTKVGFVSVLALIILLIIAIGFGYSMSTLYFAGMHYQQSIVALQSGDNATAEQQMKLAISYSPSDVYYRGLSQIYLIELNNAVNSSAGDAKAVADAKAQFNALYPLAVEAAHQAELYNPNNYQNWSAVGDANAALVPFNVVNAYQNANDAYHQVLKLNPQNPSAYLQLARIDSVQNNIDQAKKDIGQAVNLKNNYTDAYFLLAQIQVSQGDIKNAINSVTAAILTSPQNSGLYFQLGLLYYNTKDYADAQLAFQKAVQLNNVYANAMYFLGLTDYQLGKTQDAIALFTAVAKLNPNSQEVQSIIANLQAGRAPFGQTVSENTSANISTSTTPSKRIRK